MASANQHIQKKLDERKTSGAYRTLKPENNLVDFCSNDYLGLARSVELNINTDKEIAHYHKALNGSTGSRLISGNLSYTETLEKQIANYHNSEAGLIYNSGYDANVGLFSGLSVRYAPNAFRSASFCAIYVFAELINFG